MTTEAEDESFRKGEKELRNVGLQVYKTAFEARFIEETTSYYANESHNFLQGNPVNEYIKKVCFAKSVGVLLLHDVRLLFRFKRD